MVHINNTMKCMIDCESVKSVVNLHTDIQAPLEMVYLRTISSKANIHQSFTQ